MALNWLSERIGHISPWEGTKLRVLGLDALQRRHREAVWVPGSPVPAEAIFAENVWASSEGRNLIFGISESSVLKLRTRDFKHSSRRSLWVCSGLVAFSGCIRSIAACGRFFKSLTEPNPRAAIAVKGLEAQLLPEFCSRDVAAIVVDFRRSNTGETRKVSSAYFPHEEEGSFPPGPVVKLVDSTNINDRGRRLLEYLVTMEILKRDNEPTFQNDLSIGLCGLPKRHGTGAEIELCVDHLQKALMGSFGKNCSASPNKKVSWWGPGLQKLREGARRAWNRARNTGRPLDWDLYRKAQKTYKDFVVAAKRENWRRFCEFMEETNHLLETNFPDFRREPDVDSDAWTVEPKVAGPDGIFPALLQEGLAQISGPLTRTLRACLALGYIHKIWIGKTCCTSAKDFSPISLTSFLLKTLEMLFETYLRDAVLEQHPLHGNQHTYGMGFSTGTAFYSLVFQIEKDLMEGGYAVATFLDIEGAFNNTFHEVICSKPPGCSRQDGPVDHGFVRRVVTMLGTVSVGG
ncbi:hypothetical protein ACFW04_014237 [Cataglyphis niger]